MAGESAREVARRAREKAARLEARAELFERGAAGEAATAAVLVGLPPSWTAIHDVKWPGRRLANVDHVVLGPGGVFVIDSKNWSGNVALRNGRLVQNGRSREKSVAHAADAALAIAELIGPHATHVFPVLCFVDQGRSLAGWSRDVMICSSTNLNEMLLSRPAVLTPADSTDAWFRLDAQLRAAVAAKHDPAVSRDRVAGRASPRPGSAAMVPPRKRAGGRKGSGRGKTSFVKFLVGVAMLIALTQVGPELIRPLGSLLTDFMTAGLDSSACAESATARGQDC